MATRGAACQKWEEPRRPWYMREFPTAWRGIAGDDQPGPMPGEGVYNGPKDGVDYQQKGYPADGAAAGGEEEPTPRRKDDRRRNADLEGKYGDASARRD